MRVQAEKNAFGKTPLPDLSHNKEGVSCTEFIQEGYSEVKGV
jgi:hypothetical protein